jgi:hypothetical protein
MPIRTWPLAFVAVSTLLASADKKLPLERTSNETVEISGKLLDKEEIVKLFGSDLGGNIVVVRTTVRPLTEKPVRIDYDDFFLLDTGAGQRSAPYEPSQIAGNSVLIVTPTATRGGFGSNPTGPVWGGIPGTSGRPRQLPGNGGGVGNSGGEATTNESKIETDANKDKPNPLLSALKEKVLPQKKVTDNTTGLLYFQIEGKKIKPKDLELHYKTPSGRIAMRFQP